MKVLFNSFHFNGDTIALEFHPQPFKHIAQHNRQRHIKVMFTSYELVDHNLNEI